MALWWIQMEVLGKWAVPRLLTLKIIVDTHSLGSRIFSFLPIPTSSLFATSTSEVDC